MQSAITSTRPHSTRLVAELASELVEEAITKSLKRSQPSPAKTSTSPTKKPRRPALPSSSPSPVVSPPLVAPHVVASHGLEDRVSTVLTSFDSFNLSSPGKEGKGYDLTMMRDWREQAYERPSVDKGEAKVRVEATLLHLRI